MSKCQERRYCNLSKHNSGRWYCSSPNVSIFALPPDMEKCFEPREQKRGRKKMYSEAAKELAKIHDKCLEHEHDIVSDADELENMRCKAYNSRDKEEFKLIIPWLNALAGDIEAYRDYLMRLFSGGGIDE